MKFIDFCCSWGPLILGHAHPSVVDRVTATLANGTSFGTPTRLENELGELILSNHRYADRIRFVSSGTEAAMSAIRLARGVTGRDKIIKFDGCYHGHVDALLVKAGSGLATLGTSSSAGVPEAYAQETLVLPLNDLPALEACIATYKDQIAVVAIEPIPANNGLLIQDPEFCVKCVAFAHARAFCCFSMRSSAVSGWASKGLQGCTTSSQTSWRLARSLAADCRSVPTRPAKK